jgi:RNA polymerase sigma-54 factor
MRASLQFRLSQHLALTPQLQQSIRLLQLSTLELQQEVGQMLEQNPFLELDQDEPIWDVSSAQAQLLSTGGAAESVRQEVRDRDAEGQAADSATPPSGEEGGEGLADLSAGDFGTTAQDDWRNGTEADDFDGINESPTLGSGNAPSGDDDEGDPLDRRTPHESLNDHLRSQLPGLRLSGEDRAAVEVLIDSLDDDGWLADPLEEIAQSLWQALDIDADDLDAQDDLLSRLRCALHHLHRLEPAGVGARSLGECLRLQLRRLPPSPHKALALRLVDQHLELLGKRDIKRLMTLTGASAEALREAQTLLLSCEPKPGRAFTDVESQVVVPDVIVQRRGREWRASINPDVMPKLRIHSLYAEAMKGQRGGEMAGRLQEARWFVKNIQQRFDTILRVSQAIVERQKAFFTHGEIAMKPLVLREIADELGLHESTISRVTTAKYMATPFGTYELKYFFGSSLNTEAGGNASSTAVRALIKQFIAAEDPKKPLSDNHLSDMLAEQGIQVARRTVAKYREALKIAPASLRKTI